MYMAMNIKKTGQYGLSFQVEGKVRFYLCRFSKEFPDFSTHFYGELDEAWEMFKHLRSAYTLDKNLQKRVK